jgi:hypothetical protein
MCLSKKVTLNKSKQKLLRVEPFEFSSCIQSDQSAKLHKSGSSNNNSHNILRCEGVLR